MQILILLLSILFSPLALADVSFGIIRDDEIEASISNLIKPVLIAAGVNPKTVSVIIVNDKNINAFVNSTNNVFVNSGLLMQFYDDPDLLLGVVAHEMAHIKAGHLAKAYTDYQNVSKRSLVSTIILGAAALATSSPNLLIPAIAGPGHVGERTLLSYSRQSERSADQIATDLLEKSKNSAIGLKRALEYFRNNDANLGGRSVYSLTHPIPSDRLLFINHFIEKSKYPKSMIPTATRDQYVRSMLKLRCFMEPAKQNLSSLNITRQSDATYANSIILYLKHNLTEAIKLLDQLITLEPTNPFFYELKAQMFYENGRILEAISWYKQAQVLRASPLINYEYAYVLIEGVDVGVVKADELDVAISLLKKAEATNEQDVATLDQLARAYGKKNIEGVSNYYIAKAAMLRGDIHKATRFAKIASRQLPKTDGYYLKVQDILLKAE